MKFTVKLNMPFNVYSMQTCQKHFLKTLSKQLRAAILEGFFFFHVKQID